MNRREGELFGQLFLDGLTWRRRFNKPSCMASGRHRSDGDNWIIDTYLNAWQTEPAETDRQTDCGGGHGTFLSSVDRGFQIKWRANASHSRNEEPLWPNTQWRMTRGVAENGGGKVRFPFVDAFLSSLTSYVNSLPSCKMSWALKFARFFLFTVPSRCGTMIRDRNWGNGSTCEGLVASLI